MDRALRTVDEASRAVKPSQMSRLARSRAAVRLPQLGHDSTKAAYPFMSDVGECLFARLRQLAASSRCSVDMVRCVTHWPESLQTDAKQEVQALFEDLAFQWWSTHDLLIQHVLDDAVFQVHLSLWKRLLGVHQLAAHHCKEISTVVLSGLDGFKPSWRLSTGLSMERLWTRLRPKGPVTAQHLETLIRTEAIASRFDAVIWRCQASFDTMLTLRELIVRALDSVWFSNEGVGSMLEVPGMA